MNRRLFKPLGEWTLVDIDGLVEEHLPEGQRLEYKEDLPLDRERDRAELAKDISGMANAQGGIVIYGVKEDGSEEPRPAAVTPLAPAGQQTRLEDVLDSAVSPRLDYECKTLEAGDGTVLVVRVASRAGGPHMIQGYKQHRYYARRGTRTVPMTEQEVAAAYAAVSAQADNVMGLLGNLPLLPRIARARAADELQLRARGHTPQWLPLVSVTIAPLHAPSELLGPDRVNPNGFPEPLDRYVGGNRQVRGYGQFEINAWGLQEELVETETPDGEAQLVLHRVRIYRQGVCEWAHRYSRSVPDPHAIPSTSFAHDVYNALAYFASVYDTVAYAGRLAIWIRIDNADAALLSVNPRFVDFPRSSATSMESINAYFEATVDELLGDPLRIVRESMQRIWQSFGYERCLLFDPKGEWVQAR